MTDPMDELRQASADLQQTQNLTPPPELRQLWAQEAQRLNPHDPVEWMQYVSEKAAQWGADQELEACCKEFDRLWDKEEIVTLDDVIRHLRAARRPKPPSLAEEALRAHERSSFHYPGDRDAIRRALKRLQQLEEQQ